MIRRIASLMLVATLITTLCVTSAHATTFFDDGVKAADNTSTAPPPNTETKSNEKFRTDILKLVAEAKAGKVAPGARHQMQPPQSNNLSKRTKIAIGVGIAVAIVVIIVAVKADKAPGGSIPVF